MTPERIRPLLRVKLSSGLRMLLILTAALAPLGLIALYASVQSAADKQRQHQSDAKLIATAEARQIDLLIIRGADLVRFAAGAADGGRRSCRSLIADTGRLLRFDAKVALFAPGGGLRCATPGFGDTRLRPARAQMGIDIAIDPREGLVFTVNALNGSYGVGKLPVPLLRSVIGLVEGAQGVALRSGDETLVLTPAPAPRALEQRVIVSVPVAGSQAALVATSSVKTVSFVEVTLVLLPLLMWVAAAIIGWIVVNQLLLRPLAQLEQAVGSFGDGGNAAFAPPRLTSPAREIEALGLAFADTAAQIATREADLQRGLQHQVRLTREVHHRVKNNLQVVASLINLHARGAEGAVADAYASIQRRVDALAVVHRNHYAELEENRGVALRALLAELTSNLRATAAPAAASTMITLDVPPVHVSQDTAVPVAFLITEIVELLMICAPGTTIAISFEEESADRGTLLARAPALRDDMCRTHTTFFRFERIVSGLSRQLRSKLDYDAIDGAYSISIALLP